MWWGEHIIVAGSEKLCPFGRLGLLWPYLTNPLTPQPPHLPYKVRYRWGVEATMGRRLLWHKYLERGVFWLQVDGIITFLHCQEKKDRKVQTLTFI